MTNDLRRSRDADPFADFRSDGTSVHIDDRPNVETSYDVNVRVPQAFAPPMRQVPQPQQHAHAPQHTQASPPAVQPAPNPVDPHPAAPVWSVDEAATESGDPVSTGEVARPRTRRETREAEARQAAQQQPQLVQPRRPESPQQAIPGGAQSDDTHPQQIQRVEVQRYEPAHPPVDAQPFMGHLAVADQVDHTHDALLNGHPDHDDQLYDHDNDGYHDDAGYQDGDGFDGYHDDYDEHGRAEHSAMGRDGTRRKARGPRSLIILIAVLTVVGLGSYVAWEGLQPVLLKVRDQFAPAADFAGPGSTEQVIVSIADGENGKAIGQKLVAAGVVASVDAFNDAAKANPDWTSVQPGDYRVTLQLPAVDAVTALLDTENKVVNRVTTNAGWRTDQVLQAVADATGTSYDQVLAAALALPLPEGAALPPDIDRAPTAIGDWEGWFLPYTYDLGLDPTPESVLTMMRDRTVAVLDGLNIAPADRRTVLIKASLVQAEGLPRDYGMVAQVIENRIADGVPLQNGRAGPKLLQFDSTTNYATGIYDAQTTKAQRETDHSYNTYKAEGLPPGPINSPSVEAINAALMPTPGPWLFFVTVNLCTSETRFVATLSEHEDNREAYQAWLQANPKDANGKYPCG